MGLAGGVETMSSNPMTWDGGVNPGVKQFPKAASCLLPMGVTSENVAEKFGIDRKTQVGRRMDQKNPELFHDALRLSWDMPDAR